MKAPKYLVAWKLPPSNGGDGYGYWPCVTGEVVMLVMAHLRNEGVRLDKLILT